MNNYGFICSAITLWFQLFTFSVSRKFFLHLQMLCHFIFFSSFSHNFFHIYNTLDFVNWVITISSHYDALGAFVSRCRWILFHRRSVLLQLLWSFFLDSILFFFDFFFNVLYLSFDGVDLHRYALGFFNYGFFVVV